MSPVTAAALRRAAMAGGALGATFAGHALTGAHIALLPIAPALWATIVALAVLLGARRAPVAFTAWGPARLLLALVAGQWALHVVLSRAPWALGVAEHHSGAMVTTSAVAVHAVVGLVVWILLCFGQRLLVAAMAVARALLARSAPSRAPRPAEPVARDVLPLASRRDGEPRSSRGPPRGAPLPA